MIFGRKCHIGTGIVIAILIAVFLIVHFWPRSSGGKPEPSILGVYKRAAVVTNGPECAQIGSDIMEKKNGSAIDAAIASLLCEGIASLQSMGLGGGFFMTIYDAKSGEAVFVDARETAPQSAYEDMYHGNANLSLYGGLGVAVPGELKGYAKIYKKYGRLPWKELFEPAIKLCEEGSVVTKYLYDLLKDRKAMLQNEPTMAEILINPKTNELWNVGDKIKRPKLAKTLRKLADAGVDGAVETFYSGEMGKTLVNEINEFGGNMTIKDFENYEVLWIKPSESMIRNMTVYSAPLPGSGPVLTFILNVLDGLLPVKDENIMWQRIIETYKWAYAIRTELGDPKFVDMSQVLKNLTSLEYAKSVRELIKDNITYNDFEHYGIKTSMKDDHGTAHISILAPDGSAVSVTSTVNQILGGKIRSNSTGIIFNDEMDDFSSPNVTNGFNLPPSPSNYIRSGKRPFSSMSPTIVVGQDDKVRLVVGAAGGARITTAIALVMVQNLWYGYDIKKSVDTLRIHHQLSPMGIQSEENFPQGVIDYLHSIGHKSIDFFGINGAVTAIANVNGNITANSDFRRQGKVAGF